MDGYFIRRGDKTSCGGEVTGSDSLINFMGIEHAREGDSVTCGVTGLTYQIQGGVSYITSSGLRVAGSLDSVSGCPCKASLYHTWTGSTYEKEGTATTRTATLKVGVVGQTFTKQDCETGKTRNYFRVEGAAPELLATIRNSPPH